MKITKIPLLFFTCTFAACLLSFIKADDDPIRKIAAQLEKWQDVNPQEKVYIQTDKPYYAVGDDIWLKAYVTVGPKHGLSAMSGLVNVDLINPKDSITRSIKLQLNDGVAAGDFALSDTLEEGNYRIRAYTNWMRNNSPDYFFDKTIWIGSALNSNVITQTSYTYTTQNNQQTVTAAVVYTDLNGSPYAGKEVSYQVKLNTRNITRGRGVTDDKGTLRISFVNTTPALLKSGNIVTNFKLNGKTITKTLPVTATSNHVDVQFFPESGYLVTGLPSKVAFKAVGADGLGKTVSGKLLDSHGNEIADISTAHLGMGIFMITPEEGENYKAQIRFEDGSQTTYALPQVQQKGYNLSVTQHDADVFVRVTASKELTGNGNDVNLVAQAGGAMCYAAKSKLENQVLITRIPKSKFPTGIVQFTLFDPAGNPVNERIIFVNNPDGLKIDVNTAQQKYAPRDKVTLQLSSNDPENKPVISLLSAAVIDETKVPVNEDDETTILSSILLSSDIKGYIEKPNYYFAHEDVKTKADLDILMLTQGYRRFEWKKILNDEYIPVIYEAEKSLSISGTVHTSNKKPVARGKVTLFTTAGGTFIVDTLTDDNGHFSFPNMAFKDSIKFVIQARTEKGKKDVDIDLDNIKPQVMTPNVNTPDIEVNVSSKILPYLQNSKAYYEQQIKYGVGNHNILLKEVIIREKKQPLPNSSNLNGPGNADQVLRAADLDKLGCPDLTQCLQGRLTGIIFRNGKAYSMRTMNSSFRGDNPMAIIVDGMFVEDNYLTILNIQDVSSIEVLKSGSYLAIYGTRAGNGAIVVNTKRGGEISNDGYQRYTPGLITYTPKGIYKARTFYSPQYDDPKINTTLADLRSTVYWNPDIVTNKDGKSTISYANAGTKGTYRVVVEGIDADGHIGRKIFRYTVE